MKTRTKIFLILWIASVLSTIAILPYILNVQSEVLESSGVSSSFIILISLAQGIVIFGLASFLGLILAGKTGFKLPLLSSWIEHKKIKYSGTLLISVILGLVAGFAIFVLDMFLFKQLGVLMNVPLWQGFLASFYGGIVEEVIMRLFLMSLFVFVFMKVFRRKEKGSVIVWVSIILVSVLFGLGHLPITSAVVSITPMVVLRAIILNGIGGVIFGWLYWKKGLESAIIAHFSADIVLQIIVPVLFR